MTRPPLRTAVIGTGWWSTHAHLPALRSDPRSEIVAVCDRDLERARIAADAFGVSRIVADAADLVSDVDAVVIATPQGSHYAAARTFLDAGVDTLVEKPLTVDPVEAWDLVRRARASGARFHVGHTFPYHPAVQASRAGVRAGEIGAPVLATGVFSTAVAGLYLGDTEFAREHTGALLAATASTYADPVSGGHLYSQLSHAVALLLYILDEPAERVAAMENRRESPTDVADGITLRMRSGLVVSVAGAGTVHHHDVRTEEYRIFGDGGRLSLDTVTGRLSLATPGEAETITEFGSADLSRRPVERLLSAALGEVEVLVDGVLGARTVDVLEAARRSARTGGATVEIVPEEER